MMISSDCTWKPSSFNCCINSLGAAHIHGADGHRVIASRSSTFVELNHQFFMARRSATDAGWFLIFPGNTLHAQGETSAFRRARCATAPPHSVQSTGDIFRRNADGLRSSLAQNNSAESGSSNEPARGCGVS